MILPGIRVKETDLTTREDSKRVADRCLKLSPKCVQKLSSLSFQVHEPNLPFRTTGKAQLCKSFKSQLGVHELALPIPSILKDQTAGKRGNLWRFNQLGKIVVCSEECVRPLVSNSTNPDTTAIFDLVFKQSSSFLVGD